jgi:hypothetical protein
MHGRYGTYDTDAYDAHEPYCRHVLCSWLSPHVRLLSSCITTAQRKRCASHCFHSWGSFYHFDPLSFLLAPPALSRPPSTLMNPYLIVELFHPLPMLALTKTLITASHVRPERDPISSHHKRELPSLRPLLPSPTALSPPCSGSLCLFMNQIKLVYNSSIFASR